MALSSFRCPTTINDTTFMRDAVASDILAEAGIASAETAFYELFVDYGEGPVSFGLYTMIEVIDDTVIDRVFGNDDGNIYEADGTAASLAEGTFDGISTSFQKENNEDEADWSDIEALYTAFTQTPGKPIPMPGKQNWKPFSMWIPFCTGWPSTPSSKIGTPTAR